MKVISVKQPWAHAIVHLGKDIENRSWPTTYRGTVLIHASLKPDANAPNELWNLLPEEVPVFGGIIGSVEIVDCVTESDSRWFQGPFGFVLRNAKQLPFMALKGKLRIFNLPQEISTAFSLDTETSATQIVRED